jgi:acetyl-CoA carboxylase biotin carboxylase subunit
MTEIKKILIANRGEIAVRIARGCRDAGITSVAVYSDPDRTAYHVRAADEAYPLHGTTSAESYLVQDKIIAITKECGAQAIHPGYGFLAENASFAELCRKNKIIFIGPSPEVISLLGDKLEARQTAIKAGLPLAPASTQTADDIKLAKKTAAEIGFPVLIKAAAGGGGKGMRIVEKADDLEAALTTAASEATSAFGDKRVYIEKYISRPRHIEIQILADTHGNVIHLGERECSIQRRHQKVIEESPSAVVDDALRKLMGEAAVAIARESGYVGAGTVEFLVDENLKFYFLEVNTRLQVEHPVTEMVTGIDLVQEQFKIAAGEKMTLSQDDIKHRGHAIECRIYAEEAAAGFIPSTGHMATYNEPSGPGVRVDSGFVAGDDIPVYYDPLIAKLVTWGSDRDQATRRMIRALDEYMVHGVETTIPFEKMVMENQRFIDGRLSTHFIEDEFPDLAASLMQSEEELQLSAMAAALIDFQQQSRLAAIGKEKKQTADAWKLSGRIDGLRKVWR